MKNNKVKCPICRSEDLGFLLDIYIYCNNCQTAWLKKQPKAFYGNDYYQGKSSIFSYLFSPLSLFFYWLRQKYAGSGKKKLWIDVGAGEGKFLQTVRANKKIGVEISAAGRKLIAEKGAESITPQVFLKSENLQASVISFWHMLEHAENPWDYLLAAKHNLNKKGVIIIGVPNVLSWEFKSFGKNWFHLVPDYHIWHFSPKSIKKMLENAGFKIKSIDYFSLEHHPAGLLQSFINKSSGTHNILHKLVKRETDLESLSYKGIFWVLFWLSIGLPVVTVLWIINSILRRSGTMVIVASLVDKS